MESFYFRKQLLFLPIVLFLLGLGLLFVSPVSAAVDLVSFEAVAEGDQIRLEWETATELDNAGFFVRRGLDESAGPASEYDQIQVIDSESEEAMTFIPPRGDSLTGSVYIFLDVNVQAGVRYYYYLESVDTNNDSEYHGPKSAMINGESTSTPTPTSTDSETETPTATDTTPDSQGTATYTPTPSATPTRTATPRLIPTLTRTPTAGAYPAPTSGAYPAPATATGQPADSITPTGQPVDSIATATAPLGGTPPPYPAPAGTGTALPEGIATAATAEGSATATGEVSVTPSRTPSRTPSPTPEEPGSFFEGADEAGLLRLRIAIGTLVVVGLVFSGAIYYYYNLPTGKPGA